MIHLAQVSKAFGAKEAVKRVCLSLERGEVLGLIGHNGAGKTTTLRLIAGIIHPTSGDIDSPPDFKAQLGYLPDEPFAFDYLTGREMLHFMASLYQLPKESARSKILRYLQLFDLERQADGLIKDYSRGMKRKTALIGSLLHEPVYWLLDEPTESLDPVAIRTLKELIRARRTRSEATMISTHQLSFAEAVCDRLVILNRGLVVFSGTMDELRSLSAAGAALEDIYCSMVSA